VNNPSPEYNANAIGDRDSEWVKLYTDLKDGAFHPLYFLIPAFDTKYRHLFPRRVQLHQDLKRFISKIEDIIVKKRAQLLQGRSQADETEKDLCTLMLESEADGEGSSLSNDELLVMGYL
jgi:cytochrome P450